jgi:mono/diheme cytochrome c family protein
MTGAMRGLLFVLVIAACGKGDKPPPPQGQIGLIQETGPGQQQPTKGTNTGAMVEANELFRSFCANCHGVDGTGNGPAAAGFDIKPRNYTDAKWQASVTDEDIKKTIVLGGAAVGKSGLMPPNPKLKDKPAVVDALVKMIRGFAKQ